MSLFSEGGKPSGSAAAASILSISSSNGSNEMQWRTAAPSMFDRDTSQAARASTFTRRRALRAGRGLGARSALRAIGLGAATSTGRGSEGSEG